MAGWLPGSQQSIPCRASPTARHCSKTHAGAGSCRLASLSLQAPCHARPPELDLCHSCECLFVGVGVCVGMLPGYLATQTQLQAGGHKFKLRKYQASGEAASEQIQEGMQLPVLGSQLMWVLHAAVKAKVLAVDAGKQRLSLGMKESYFVAEDEQGPGAAADAPDLDAQLLQQMQSRSRPDDNAGPDGLAGGLLQRLAALHLARICSR